MVILPGLRGPGCIHDLQGSNLHPVGNRDLLWGQIVRRLKIPHTVRNRVTVGALGLAGLQGALVGSDAKEGLRLEATRRKQAVQDSEHDTYVLQCDPYSVVRGPYRTCVKGAKGGARWGDSERHRGGQNAETLGVEDSKRSRGAVSSVLVGILRLADACVSCGALRFAFDSSTVTLGWRRRMQDAALDPGLPAALPADLPADLPAGHLSCPCPEPCPCFLLPAPLNPASQPASQPACF
jgi:hypothetical protein